MVIQHRNPHLPVDGKLSRMIPRWAFLFVIVGSFLSESDSNAADIPLVEIVAPIGLETSVNLGKGNGMPAKIVKSDFTGKNSIQSHSGRTLLVVSPNEKSTPADLLVTLNGQTTQYRILPIDLGDSDSALELQSPGSDPSSREHITITQKINGAARIFNGQERRNLQTIVISGPRLVLKRAGGDRISDRLAPGGKPSNTIERLDIYAKEVIVAGQLRLPGTEVRIHAQTLEFKDNSNELGAINTSPVDKDDAPASGVDGADGERGGNVFLYVERVMAPTPSGERFCLRGSVGQIGGVEANGKDGVSLRPMEKEPQIGGLLRSWNDGRVRKSFHGGNLPSGWEQYGSPQNVVWFRRETADEWGAMGTWPGDGDGGTAGGKPGTGGGGGTLHSSCSVETAWVNCDGGKSGAQRATGRGGQPGQPEIAVGIQLKATREFIKNARFVLNERTREFEPRDPRDMGNWVDFANYDFHIHQSKRGADKPSPGASSPHGQNGSVSVDIKGWLHPIAANAVLRYAEEQYRIGAFDRAKEELTLLAKVCSAPNAIENDQGEYLAIVQRANTLLSRLASNLDFFGNPTGWIPSLDLAGTLKLLQSEAKESSAVIVAVEALRAAAEDGQAKRETLTSSRDAAAQQLGKYIAQLDTQQAKLPLLEKSCKEAIEEEKVLEGYIVDRAKELEREAHERANPQPTFVKAALSTLSNIAKVVPVGQPALGGVAIGIDMLTAEKEMSNGQILGGLEKMGEAFSSEGLRASYDSYKKAVADLNSFDPKSPRKAFDQAKGTAGVLNESFKKYKELQVASRASAADIDVLLQKIRENDPSLRDLVEITARLTKRKASLVADLDITIANIGETTSQISILIEAIDALNLELGKTENWLDHPAVLAGSEISEHLRERLDYYHYLVVKAFEYSSATLYTGNRQAAGTAQIVFDVLKQQNGDLAKAAEAYRSVYVDEVRQVGRKVIQRFVEEGPGQQKTISLVLNKDEISALNAMLIRKSNDKLLFLNLEDRGIMPTSDAEARLVGVQLSKCNFKMDPKWRGSANLQFDFVSGQRGVIKRRDRSILYRSNEGRSGWGASVDLTKQRDQISPISRPEDIGAILANFIGEADVKNFVVAPPLLPGIAIKPGIFSDTAVEMEIQAMTLELTYSYRSVNSVARSVRVVPTGIGEEVPFFYVSSADDGNLQHASGSFTRFFGHKSNVEYVAPISCGKAIFDGWYQEGRKLSGLQRFSIPTEYDSYRFEARYRLRDK